MVTLRKEQSHKSQNIYLFKIYSTHKIVDFLVWFVTIKLVDITKGINNEKNNFVVFGLWNGGILFC